MTRKSMRGAAFIALGALSIVAVTGCAGADNTPAAK